MCKRENRDQSLSENDIDTFYLAVTYFGLANTLNLLISHKGADLSVTANGGFNALHCAAWDSGDVPTLKYLLRKGINISDKTNDGKTALMLAREKGNNAAAEFLASYVEGNNNIKQLTNKYKKMKKNPAYYYYYYYSERWTRIALNLFA